MSYELLVLALSVASVAFLHTVLGPDHYLPFVAMARAGGWSIKKTSTVTVLCGLGHIAGSVLLGAIGIALGFSLTKLEFIEESRGTLAAWLLIAFGLLYFVWGLKRATKFTPHKHFHVHPDGVLHSHPHVHTGQHMHVHEQGSAQSITPWVLFAIFVFGPCEVLIPLLMYPAATLNSSAVIVVIAVFSLVTIATMLGIVLAALYGLKVLPTFHLERYAHAVAGATVCLCGVAMVWLGL